MLFSIATCIYDITRSCAPLLLDNDTTDINYNYLLFDLTDTQAPVYIIRKGVCKNIFLTLFAFQSK